MKPAGFIAFIIAALFSFAGISTRAVAGETEDKPAETSADANAPASWSVVGRWSCTGPDGTDTINIRSDGTFSRSKDDESGRWTLMGTQDHVVLTLGWENFPQMTASLIKADEFRGMLPKGGMVLVRLPPAAGADAAQAQQPAGAAEQKNTDAGAGEKDKDNDGKDKPVTINLLDKAEHDSWEVESGHWGFDKDGLTGSGDSLIHYVRKIPPPFQLKFDVVVLDGMRPRLYFGHYIFANEGYSNTFALFPEYKHTQRLPYELKKKYSVQIDATSDTIELRINGNVIDSRDTGIDTIQELVFSGGDWWSAGSACFSNITITCRPPDVERPKKRKTPAPQPSPPSPSQPAPTPTPFRT